MTSSVRNGSQKDRIIYSVFLILINLLHITLHCKAVQVAIGNSITKRIDTNSNKNIFSLLCSQGRQSLFIVS